MVNDKNLLVFDASAGSGKTYNLSQKFSEYLISEYKNGRRDVHRLVMAVTFTNKATFEMKSRIITTLYAKSKDDSNPDKDVALEILRHLVHDYTMFRVSTIDSFFQKILKAFAVEMGSQSAYETTLDHQTAVEAALDNIYAKLGNDKEGAQLLQAMEEISLRRLDEGKNWNWRDDLLAICRKVVSPQYRGIKSDDSSQKLRKFAQKCYKRADELQKIFAEEVIELYDKVIEGAAGLDLKALKVNNAIQKFLQGRLADGKVFTDKASGKIVNNCPEELKTWLDNPHAMLNKGGNSFSISQVNDCCGQAMRSIRDLFDKYYREYVTLSLISRNLKETLLLESVSQELDSYLREHQLTLLSDAPQILSSLIDGSGTPFVYDKLGSVMNHYLLDEFQDTSEEQWENFKPLLQEGLSRGEGSLIVGDVKQSIYRWRGGNWNLLKKNVPQEFADHYDIEPLDTNYRSLENIVAFNNYMFSSSERKLWFDTAGQEDNVPPGYMVKAFMDYLQKKELAPALVSEVRDIYAGSAQHLKPEFGNVPQKGVVHVISAPLKAQMEGGAELVLWDVARKIQGLISSSLGYSLKDIAILTNKKEQAGMIANYLVGKGISIVSSESLLLDSNPVVIMLVEILRKIANPKDRGLEAVKRLYGLEASQAELLEIASEEGLYALCRRILRTFLNELQDGDMAFVKAFLDKVMDYTFSYGSSLADFLKWWDSQKQGFYIPEPSEADSVKIMTMHKAKGLAFKVVFIPFLRDKMVDSRYDLKWFTLPEDRLGYAGPLLIHMGKDLKNSEYAQANSEEEMQLCMDSLNLAYVSFTRPRERLYIYSDSAANAGTVSKALSTICSALSKDGNKLFEARTEDIDAPNGSGPYEMTDYVIGNDMEVSYSSDETDCANEEIQPEIIDSSALLHEPSNAKLRGVYEDYNIRFGVLWHELFSYIDSDGNTEGSLRQKISLAVQMFLSKNSGSILGDDPDVLSEEVAEKIGFTLRSGYDWFKDGHKVLGERSIISSGGTWRPDRIILPSEGKEWAEVIDYKFGGYDSGSESGSGKDRKYRRQVATYMKLLSEMGYGLVRGYIWYVTEDVIHEVSE